MIETILKMKYNKEYNAFNIKNIYIRYKYCLNSLLNIALKEELKYERCFKNAHIVFLPFFDYLIYKVICFKSL